VKFVLIYKLLKDLIFSQCGISNTPSSHRDFSTRAWILYL